MRSTSKQSLCECITSLCKGFLMGLPLGLPWFTHACVWIHLSNNAGEQDDYEPGWCLNLTANLLLVEELICSSLVFPHLDRPRWENTFSRVGSSQPCTCWPKSFRTSGISRSRRVGWASKTHGTIKFRWFSWVVFRLGSREITWMRSVGTRSRAYWRRTPVHLIKTRWLFKSGFSRPPRQVDKDFIFFIPAVQRAAWFSHINSIASPIHIMHSLIVPIQ